MVSDNIRPRPPCFAGGLYSYLFSLTWGPRWGSLTKSILQNSRLFLESQAEGVSAEPHFPRSIVLVRSPSEVSLDMGRAFRQFATNSR